MTTAAALPPLPDPRTRASTAAPEAGNLSQRCAPCARAATWTRATREFDDAECSTEDYLAPATNWRALPRPSYRTATSQSLERSAPALGCGRAPRTCARNAAYAW